MYSSISVRPVIPLSSLIPEACVLTDSKSSLTIRSNSTNVHQVIGNTTDPKAATTAEFKAFWNEFAKRFVHNEKVIFGINNEPHDMVCDRSWFIFGFRRAQIFISSAHRTDS